MSSVGQNCRAKVIVFFYLGIVFSSISAVSKRVLTIPFVEIAVVDTATVLVEGVVSGCIVVIVGWNLNVFSLFSNSALVSRNFRNSWKCCKLIPTSKESVIMRRRTNITTIHFFKVK